MLALIPWMRRSMALPRTENLLGWMPEEFATLMNRFFTPVAEIAEWPNWWGMTTEENEKEVILRIELPGFEPSEVRVEMLGERLTVEAEHREPEPPTTPPPEKTPEKTEERPERAYAHVRRVITLPPEVEPEKVEAIYRNGVLEVHVPRRPEAVGRRIEVKT